MFLSYIKSIHSEKYFNINLISSFLPLFASQNSLSVQWLKNKFSREFTIIKTMRDEPS